jgi:class 3 adenylate cyclase/hemoglobin-like flavoprotein
VDPKTNVAPVTVRYKGIEQEFRIPKAGKSLLQISLEHKIPHLHECGGMGKCTTCRVRVHEGHKNLNPPTKIERDMMEQRRWEPGIRLACQSRVYGDVEVERLIWSSAEVQKTQTEMFPEGKAEERPIAILFCDLRDFTKISTQHFAFDMAYMLNRFYTIMGDPILMNNGIIYQYVGDEIVGIFGTTGGTKEKACMEAIRAAVGMSYALDRLNQQELSSVGTSLDIGIGIHFGKAYVGHLGHPQFRQFSVVGDPVNTASRVQGYTRPSKTRMLISETVAAAIPEDTLQLGKKFKPELKGLGDSLELIELVDFAKLDMQLELQSSLNLLLQDQDTFAANFYKTLFSKAPGLRQLFHGDLVSQGRMLTHMLMGIVYSLSRPEFLSSGLESLGRNHTRYGVMGHHYQIALEAFMETIAQTLGEQATPKILKSWEMALAIVIDGMKRGAN